MDEFKNIISSVPNETLNAIFAIYTNLLTEVPRGSAAYQTFSLMVKCVKDEFASRGMSNSGGYVSESEKRSAMKYLASHGINVGNNTYESKKSNDVFDGIIGFGIFILIIIAIAVVKGLFDIIVNLWNSGVLKIILGLGTLGGGVYLGYKKGLFEKIKNNFGEFKQRNKGKNHGDSENKSKEIAKKNDGDVVSFTKEFVKSLTICSSAVVVLGTGMAHLDKHTKVLDGTFLEDAGNKCRIAYEYTGRFAREKVYELTNDYSEFEENGYMAYLNPYYTVNNRNWNYDNGDIYLHVSHDRTWEWLSSYCYGNSKFSKHLRLYNSRYDLSDEIVHEGDIIFVPSPEKLEDYIYEKRLIKKR